MTGGKKILAVIAILALIVTGTYAMHRSISEDNEFIGKRCDEGGDDPVLHDDFDPNENMKDIYVENRGSTTLFVRIKLSEAMSLTDHRWRPASESELIAHIYGPSADNCSHSNSAGKMFHDYFSWNMGGWKYYKPASSAGKVNDTNIYTEADYNDPSKGVYRTPDAQIITASAFLAMETAAQKTFTGWIYDTDGYAYWSKPLKSKDVTGLLLHGVTTSASLKNTEYYYVINVLVETVDREDIPMWTEGKESADGEGVTMDEATADGKEVILIIAGKDDDNGGNGGGNNGDDTGGGDNNGGNNGGNNGDGNGGGNGDNTGGGDNTGDGDNSGGDNSGSGGELSEIPGLDSNTQINSVLDINGSQWIVIKNIEMEGSYYAMLLKKTAMGHIVFDMDGSQYEGSNLQKEFTNAYTDSHIPAVLMNNAVVPKLGDDSKTAVSAPTSKMASSQVSKKDIIFPLSYKEAVDWSGSDYNAMLNLGTMRWWLRTPERTTHWHYVVSTTSPSMGSITTNITSALKHEVLYLRPAIWVKYE